MGVAFGALIEDSLKKKIDFKELNNKTFGIDAYNMLYQFVTTIRGIDGEPLKNENGEITSHYSGLFYRVSNIISNGIKPTFVFDGVSHELKNKTKQDRRDKRQDAKKQYDLAALENNLEDMNKFAKMSATINEKIILESKELLSAMGVSYIDSPGEAEAQISYMTKNGLFDYTVSQDYDCILFGSPNLLKNIGSSGKKKVPFKKIFVDVYPYVIDSESVFNNLEINREKIIWLSMLIGTDFNDKVESIGPKTALKLVREYNSFEDILKYLENKKLSVNFDYKEIQDIFLNPNIDENPKIITSEFNKEKIEKILIDKANFDEIRINNFLKTVIEKKEENNKQKSISDWF